MAESMEQGKTDGFYHLKITSDRSNYFWNFRGLHSVMLTRAIVWVKLKIFQKFRNRLWFRCFNPHILSAPIKFPQVLTSTAVYAERRC